MAVEFRWIEWNRAKIAAHNLTTSEVEYAWYNRFGDDEFEHPLHGTYYESFGTCPSGRIIKIVWRWDLEGVVEVVFVITAFGTWKKR